MSTTSVTMMERFEDANKKDPDGNLIVPTIELFLSVLGAVTVGSGGVETGRKWYRVDASQLPVFFSFSGATTGLP